MSAKWLAILAASVATSAAVTLWLPRSADPFLSVVLPPGFDPTAVRFESPAARVEVDARGDLDLRIDGRQLHVERPQAYQNDDGVRHSVTVQFALDNRGDIRLVFGPYDQMLPLTITPFSADAGVR